MVKAYLRYEPKSSFGIIASNYGPSIYAPDAATILAPALEDVLHWDVKKGLLKGKWHDPDNKAQVSAIARSPDSLSCAVGYSDGSIRLWSFADDELIVTLNGHRGAISTLSYHPSGQSLASGSNDTNIIVWDIVGQVGLYRLRGHKDQITALAFVENDSLLSLSKDTLLKLWDLSTQHCRETIVAHRGEAWCMALADSGDRFITAGGDRELKVWAINEDALHQGVTIGKEPLKVISPLGAIDRASSDRAAALQFHPSGKYIACQSAGKTLEIFRLRQEEEVRKKQARRAKRLREKAAKSLGPEADADIDIPDAEADATIPITDLIAPYKTIRAPAKIRSFDFKPPTETALNPDASFDLLLAISNNSLEVWRVPAPSSDKATPSPDPERQHILDLPGHRSDVRTLCLSSDAELLATASTSLLKIWNVATATCIRTIPCGHALASAFLPGDRQLVLGTKAGALEIYDLGSSAMIESIDAHSSSIWSLAIRPDRKGLITGSADKDVKFWDFDIISGPSASSSSAPSTSRRLTLVHMRTLRMSDDVLCVRYSPDQRLVAISLLDATVKVFHHDTLKFFLSLYGHKLPVLSMDISSDSALLVTASADKNVKLWGLDFGDCHKSLYAHQESIMAVHFVPRTHYFFTAGKDKLIKYWDGDKFDAIQRLEGHQGEVWALAIGLDGARVVSASADRSIRVWERSEEQLFLEEEREQELEALYETNLAAEMDRAALSAGPDGEVGEEGVGEAAGKRTIETLKAGERILEAIHLADEERTAWALYRAEEARAPGAAAPPPSNLVLVHSGNLSPEQYVLKTLEKVKLADLEEALLTIPFDAALALLVYLDLWAARGWNAPLSSRILVFLLKTYHRQIVSNRMVRPVLDSIRSRLRASLTKQKDMMGFNLAGLIHMRRDIEAKATADFFDEDALQAAEEDSAKKRKFVTV